MDFLHGLHGTVAALLICALLFVDEAGIPLPIAPSEILLIVVGILMSGQAFPPWIIMPVAFAFMLGGMMTGYGWARTLGQSGLETLANKVGATDVYRKAQDRLQSANSWGIALARLLPGARPYATLVSGAAEVDLRTFLLGAVPALIVWECVWILVGYAVGLPVAHLLGRFEKLAMRGAILIVLAAVSWFAIRRVSADERNGIGDIAPRLRASLALVVDACLVSCTVGGAFGLVRWILNANPSIWFELGAAAFLLIALLVVGRTIQTPGERLFSTNYWHTAEATAQ